MNVRLLRALMLALACAAAAPAMAQAPEKKETVCFESRKGATDVVQRELRPGLANVRCSPCDACVRAMLVVILIRREALPDKILYCLRIQP